MLFIDLRRLERPNRRNFAAESLHLHERGLRAWTLRQLRGSLVQGEDIRVSVTIQTPGYPRLNRVVPRAGGHLHHAGSNHPGHHRAGQSSSAIVEHANNVAIADTPV